MYIYSRRFPPSYIFCGFALLYYKVVYISTVCLHHKHTDYYIIIISPRYLSMILQRVTSLKLPIIRFSVFVIGWTGTLV